MAASKAEFDRFIVDQILADFSAKVDSRGTVYLFVPDMGHVSDLTYLRRFVLSRDPTITPQRLRSIEIQVRYRAPMAEPTHEWLGVRGEDANPVTGEVCEVSPERLVANRLPWPLVPDADTDRVENTLSALANGSDATYLNLEEVLGIAIAPMCLGLIPGLTGAADVPDGGKLNGKTAILKTTSHLLSEGNFATLPLQAFGHRFQDRHLEGVLCDICDDAPDGKIDPASASVLKRAVTGGTIYTDVKGGEGYSFESHLSVIMASNAIPRWVSDAGLIRRFRPIPLTAQFEDDGTDVAAELLNEEDMTALLAHAWRGLHRILERKQAGSDGTMMWPMSPNSAADRLMGIIVSVGSDVRAWLEDEGLTAELLDREPCTSTFAAYKSWAYGGGREPLERKDFDVALHEALPSLVQSKCRGRNGEAATRRWTLL